MRTLIATRVDARGVSRPAWMDAPPRVRASTIAAREKEKEAIRCLLTQKEEQT